MIYLKGLRSVYSVVQSGAALHIPLYLKMILQQPYLPLKQ